MTTGTRSLTSGKAASFERFVVPALHRAEIEVGGSQPWDIQIHDRRFYRRVVDACGVDVGEIAGHRQRFHLGQQVEAEGREAA